VTPIAAAVNDTVQWLLPFTPTPTAGFYLPASATVVRALIRDGFGASSFVDLSVSVQPSQAASVLSTVEFVSERMQSLLQPLLSPPLQTQRGSLASALLLVQQLAEELTAGMAVTPSLSNSTAVHSLNGQLHQHLYALAVQTALPAELTDSPSLAQLAEQALAAVVSEVSGAWMRLRFPGWQRFVSVLDTLMDARRVAVQSAASSVVGEPSAPLPLFEGARFASVISNGALFNCSWFPLASVLLQDLLTLSLDGTLASSVRAWSTDNFLALAQRFYTAQGSDTLLGANALDTTLATYAASLDPNTAINFDTTAAVGWSRTDLRVVRYGPLWSACSGVPSLTSVTLVSSSGLHLNLTELQVPILFDSELTAAQVSAVLSSQLAQRCGHQPDGWNATLDLADGMVCGYLDQRSGLMSD